MERHAAPLKYLRQSRKRRFANRAKKTVIKTFTKKAIQAAEAGDFEAARKYQNVTIKLIDRASKGSTLHKKTAARKKSRLHKRITTLEKAAS